jgi:hypothetical protein
MTAAEPSGELDVRYGDPDAVPTPWADTRRVITDAELFWISTVRADGSPHVTPVPAVWDGDALHFCTGADEQKGVNLARNPRCTLTTGNNLWKQGLDVVVEGAAVRVTDDSRLQQLADAWEAKYHGDWHFDVANHAFQGGGGEALVFAVVPSKILAFAKGDFAQTRYRF